MFSRRGATDSGAGPPAPARRTGLFLGLARAAGLASLAYIAGAAVVYFDLPTSGFLRRALGGAAAWYQARDTEPTADQAPPPKVGPIDRPDRTADGFTLCMYGGNSQAVLVDMRGREVHRWHVPFSRVWPAPTHVKGRVNDADVYFNDGHVYPNGDLLAVVEGPINANNPSNGYGLVKLDKDSRVLWKYAEWCHHDLDVGDDGTIYVLTNAVAHSLPRNLGHIPTPCMVDAIDVLSPDGRRLKRIPLLEAIHDSPYAPLLGVLERASPLAAPGGPGPAASAFRDDELRRDVLHTNAVKVLPARLAARFPMWKPGQLLVSPRNLDALAVVDPDTEKVVWAARGPWHAQHDPSFLDNGHLLLFDNLGSPGGSRALEYDPRTQAFPWAYPGEDNPKFTSRIRGMCQRLANGNTLVVNSVGGEVFEVTPDREVVWSLSTGGVTLNRARRYAPDRLVFLKGGPRARP
jgi:hypothetical protein